MEKDSDPRRFGVLALLAAAWLGQVPGTLAFVGGALVVLGAVVGLDLDDSAAEYGAGVQPAAERSAEASDSSKACSTVRSGRPWISTTRPL